MNESRLLTRALPMQEPPGQLALTLEDREAKGGVGELVHYCILSYTILHIANTFYDDIEICVFILYGLASLLKKFNQYFVQEMKWSCVNMGEGLSQEGYPL